MRGSIFALLLVLTWNVSCGESSNKTLPNKLELPVIKLSYPEKFQRTGTQKAERDVIQKEDPTDVEVISVSEGQVFDGEERKGDVPNYYDYPRGFYPYNPASPGGPGLGNPVNPGGPVLGNPVNPVDPGSGVNPLYPPFAGEIDAFTARKAVHFELFPGNKIQFVDTITKLGFGWNNVTSEFVCRSPGIFFFTFTICGEQYRHFRASLKLNGFGIVSAFGDLNGYQMASNSAVLRLLTGDVVYLALDEGSIYEVSTLTGRAYNTFSGFRIL